MKLKQLLLTLTIAVAATCVATAQNTGMKIHFLSVAHGLIQVQEPQKYVLLPVEEAAPDATINILVNNEISGKLKIRLAMNHVDYYVPFDLTRFNGKSVTLDIHTESNRTNVRDAAEAVWGKDIKLSNSFSTANYEKYRPLYHHTPAYGWMNDPNGMVYKDGEYHLFFQHNPFGSTWNNMTWGHSVSKDMITWENRGDAIEPNGLGDVFSGNSVVDKNNTAGFGKDAIIAIYTSAGESQFQSLAYSTDNGKSFKVWEKSPIITANKECRDPNMFWDAEHNQWVMILACPLDYEMWIYTSPDLKNWTKQSAFGKGYGCQDGIWECPDLMQLPVKGTDKSKWVLICNLNPGGIYGGSATQYFVGDFDGYTFTCESKPEVTKWLDYGKDHYATVSWSNMPDNRHTVIAWMNNWQYAGVTPTKQYRSSNSLPRDLALYEGSDGETYVSVTPSPEVEAYRGKSTAYKFSASNKAVSKALPTANDGVCEIDLAFNYGSANKVNIELFNNNGDKVVMTYDRKSKTVSMDRNKSGITDFSADFPAVTAAPCDDDNNQRLRLFIDRSSIEAFATNGHYAITNTVYPTIPYSHIAVSTDKGKCKVTALTIYSINTSK